MMFDLVRWLREEALPLWAEIGFEARTGLFHEQLDLRARPTGGATRRLMVQARQIYVFAAAEMMGWYQGASLAEQAGDHMLRFYTEDDGRDGFAFSVRADGAVQDGERDLYAQAFALFALAWLARLTGNHRYIEVADATLAFLDNRMATPQTGGYAETVFVRQPLRRQNPHMHLVEALLALHEAEPDRGYLARADSLIDLMQRKFLHGSAPALVEFYDAKLEPAETAPFCFEPGHHFEWAWLLSRHAQIAGRGQLELAKSLWSSAAAAISDGSTIPDSVDDRGVVRFASTRLWPHAEAVRAATLEHIRDVAPSVTKLGGLVLDALNSRFLQPAYPGCWIDRYDAEGRPLTDVVPASSLYHLAGAAMAIECS